MTKSPNSTSKTRLAEILGLTTRQLSNLNDEGMPRIVDGNRVTYDLPAAVQWYTAKLKAGAGNQEKVNLTTRRLELEVAVQEIELGKLQGSLVSLDYMEQQLGSILQRLRAKLLNVPGKYAPSMVGLRTVAEAQTRLEGLSTEMIVSLSDTGEDPELDDDDDTSVSESGVAA